MIKVLQIAKVDRAEGFCKMYFLTELCLFLLDSAAAPTSYCFGESGDFRGYALTS